MERNEALEKSIDTMIDELFSEREALEKAKPETIAIAEKKVSNQTPMESKKSPTTADANGAKKEGEEDEEEGKKRGRPDDLSQMSMRDKDGASKGTYDASITHPPVEVPNETTVSKPSKMKKAFEVSEEDYELLQKAKAAREEEALKKARTEQVTLIKSAVQEAISPLKAENEQLRKSLADQEALIKSMAKKPQPRKSISSAQVLEKSFGQGGEGPKVEQFSKSEMLDAAERLMKSGSLRMEHVIELEDTGFIYDPNARKRLEEELRKP